MSRRAARLRRRQASPQGIADSKIHPDTKKDGYRPGLIEPPILGDWKFLGCVISITVIAFVLRSYQIGRSELWLDEAASYYYTTTEIRMGNAAFYYFLLRGWIHIAGQSEAALRLLSAIFGTLSVAGVMGFARMILGRWAGV